MATGDPVGVAVGPSVRAGAKNGLSVEGEGVGMLLGVAVGKLDGEIDGLAEGGTVGAVEGVSDGAIVGV